MIKSIVILFVVTLTESVRINSSLAKTLQAKATANVTIHMANETNSVLDGINIANFQDRGARLTAVADALKSHAAKSQKDILNLLSIKNISFHSLWISNEIFIPNADVHIVQKLATFQDIAEIHEEYIVKLNDPIDVKIVDKSEVDPLAEQGIRLIKAHLVWSQLGNNGKGAIVANIDSGVRGSHETLRNNFRGKYGWFDPYLLTRIPNDSNGHGTHTMGTIAGRLGVGVAPGATWMACSGCLSSYWCTQFHLTRCAEFISCPTLADGSDSDCTKAPHVVSNSWGFSPSFTWFNSCIDAWHKGGIIPVFANGNSGPSCTSVVSPADSVLKIIAVGASTFTDSLYNLSSVGPSVTNLIKPDITAPGEYIRSAYRNHDSDYVEMSGTSMAAPHVAGIVALLVAENRNLEYDEIEKILYQNTEQKIISTGQNCGGIDESKFPNNAFGWGRVDGFESVQSLQASFSKI